MLNCPACGALVWPAIVHCQFCGAPLDVPALPSGPLVLQATPTHVDDIPTDDKGKATGQAYTAAVPRLDGVPERDYDTGYLLARRADMLAGEGRYGIGLDVLAECAPYIYSKGRIRASLQGQG